jgi:hypothetical protein
LLGRLYRGFGTKKNSGYFGGLEVTDFSRAEIVFQVLSEQVNRFAL